MYEPIHDVYAPPVLQGQGGQLLAGLARDRRPRTEKAEEARVSSKSSFLYSHPAMAVEAYEQRSTTQTPDFFVQELVGPSPVTFHFVRSIVFRSKHIIIWQQGKASIDLARGGSRDCRLRCGRS